MLHLAIRNVARRPWRSLLTIGGLVAASAMLFVVQMCDAVFRQSLQKDMRNTGAELMLVPMGCPYDAAAQIARGRGLKVTLPAESLTAVRNDPAVAVAAPILSVVVPRPSERRTDLWVGIDDAYLRLKPWLRLQRGSTWFRNQQSVILGADAAQAEMRRPGDLFANPRTGAALTVCGVFERTGGSDDSLFFVPLRTAQRIFGQEGKLTAVSIRLKDPSEITGAAQRLQRIRGAQVVTLTEVIGTFLNVLNLARTFANAATLVALAIAGLTVFNTMMASVMERTAELSVMRAMGASRVRILLLTGTEALFMCVFAGCIGLALAVVCGALVKDAVGSFLGIAVSGRFGFHVLTPIVDAWCYLTGAACVAAVYPAVRAAAADPAVAMRG